MLSQSDEYKSNLSNISYQMVMFTEIGGETNPAGNADFIAAGGS